VNQNDLLLASHDTKDDSQSAKQWPTTMDILLTRLGTRSR
jgi:hypothetical protein